MANQLTPIETDHEGVGGALSPGAIGFFGVADDSGDGSGVFTFQNRGQSWLWVYTDNGTAVEVKVLATDNRWDDTLQDETVSLSTGHCAIWGPLDPRRFNDNQQRVTVAFDPVTGNSAIQVIRTEPNIRKS